MKTLILGIITATLFTDCQQEASNSILKTTINQYESFISEFGREYTLTVLRNQYRQNPLEYKVKRRNQRHFAIIQTVPEERILKNFRQNELTAEFVSRFKKIDCRRLVQDTSFVIIQLLIRDSSFYLYRGEMSRSYFFTKNSKALVDGWRYSSRKFRGER